jgi:hypothetical protein
VKFTVGGVDHDLRVEAAMSVPRLGFMDNFFCLVQAILPHGIKPTKYSGAFWEQCLDRVLLELVERTDWILTCDYDSVFEADTIQRLMAVALATGYDAVAPLQAKRDCGAPMFTPKGHTGIGMVELPNSYFEALVQPVETAHFGCTLIRSAALKRLPAPWFQSFPNSAGHWGDAKPGEEDRVDSDIYFWRAWTKAGNTLGVAPQVAIGHAELVITWPGRDLKPVYQYPADYWAQGGRRCARAWGSIEHAEASECHSK